MQLIVTKTEIFHTLVHFHPTIIPIPFHIEHQNYAPHQVSRALHQTLKMTKSAQNSWKIPAQLSRTMPALPYGGSQQSPTGARAIIYYSRLSLAPSLARRRCWLGHSKPATVWYFVRQQRKNVLPLAARARDEQKSIVRSVVGQLVAGWSIVVSYGIIGTRLSESGNLITHRHHYSPVSFGFAEMQFAEYAAAELFHYHQLIPGILAEL